MGEVVEFISKGKKNNMNFMKLIFDHAVLRIMYLVFKSTALLQPRK